MKKKHYTDEEELKVTDYNSTGTTVRWLITRENEGAPRYALRRFEIQPEGKIGLHGHPEEHEIYCLNGKGEVFTSKDKFGIKKDDVLYVPPEEEHGYKNTGDEPLVFLCIIPYLD